MEGSTEVVQETKQSPAAAEAKEQVGDGATAASPPVLVTGH
jgi:hypothetical protein